MPKISEKINPSKVILLKEKKELKILTLNLENWRNLKSNSEKMISELTDRKDKITNRINGKSKKSLNVLQLQRVKIYKI